MLSFKDIEKNAEAKQKYKRKCTHCDHTIFVPPVKPKVICTWCGTLNYYDKKTEYDDKMKSILRKDDR